MHENELKKKEQVGFGNGLRRVAMQNEAIQQFHNGSIPPLMETFSI